MQEALTYIKQTRALFIQLLNELNMEQLNEVPQGFSNNIAWNFGHIVVSTQVLCYVRSGIEKDLEISFLEKYQKGSKPGDFISKEEIEELKKQAIGSIQKIERDIQVNKFGQIEPFATSTFKLTMQTIEEVVTCCLAHDAMHYGYAVALKKSLQSVTEKQTMEA
jgi:hypothetical protein